MTQQVSMRIFQPTQQHAGSYRPQLNPNLQQTFIGQEVKQVPKTTTNKHKLPISGAKGVLMSSVQRNNSSTNKNSARADAYNLSEQIHVNKNQKYQGGGQFRNAKSLKKTSQNQPNLRSNMQFAQMNLQQQYSSLQQLQKPELFNSQYTSVNSTQAFKNSLNPQTSVPLLGEQPKPINIIQQMEMRQHSQESMQSADSLNAYKSSVQTQDQHRKRLVALAQAQQQQILVAAQGRPLNMLSSISNKMLGGNHELSRISSDVNFNSGVKVISKKLISFRSQSKSGEKKHKIEFRNSNKQKFNNNAYDKQNTIKVKMNQTQTFTQALQQSPQHQNTGTAGPSTYRGKPQQQTNPMDMSPITQGQTSKGNPITSQQSPAKYRDKKVSQEPIPKVPANRLQSGPHTRKINVNQNKGAEALEMVLQANNSINASNNQSNRRRVVQQAAQLDTGDKLNQEHGMTLRVKTTDKKGVINDLKGGKPQAQSSTSQKVLQNGKNNLSDQTARTTNYNASARLNTEPEAPLHKPVIYHPHPLNQSQNILEFNTIQTHQHQQTRANQNSLPTLPLANDNAASTGAGGSVSQRHANSKLHPVVVNNRNSRLNLKPLGKKKPSYKLTKTSSNQFTIHPKPPSQAQAQYQQSGNTQQHSIVPHLKLYQAQTEASGSRDRSNAQGATSLLGGGNAHSGRRHLVPAGTSSKLKGKQSSRHQQTVQSEKQQHKQESQFKTTSKMNLMGQAISSGDGQELQSRQLIEPSDKGYFTNAYATVANYPVNTEDSSLDLGGMTGLTDISAIHLGTDPIRTNDFNSSDANLAINSKPSNHARTNLYKCGGDGSNSFDVIPTFQNQTQIYVPHQQVIKVNLAKVEKTRKSRQQVHRNNDGMEQQYHTQSGALITSKDLTKLKNSSTMPQTAKHASQQYILTKQAFTIKKEDVQQQGKIKLSEKMQQQKEKGFNNKPQTLTKGTEHSTSTTKLIKSMFQPAVNQKIVETMLTSQYNTTQNHAIAIEIAQKQNVANQEHEISEFKISLPIFSPRDSKMQKRDDTQITTLNNKATIEEDLNQVVDIKIVATKPSPSKKDNALPLSLIREEGPGSLEDTNSSQYLQTQCQADKQTNEVKQIMAEQRTTMDTNSNRKQNTDSKTRTNFNTSIGNVPRGLINTAFSLNSTVSREEVPLLPLNPQKVLKYYINELTDYEKAEVLDYDVVYFLGKSKKNKADQKERTLPDEKKEAEKQDSSPCKSENEAAEKEEKVYNHNYGYDDASGDYKIVVGDHVGYRYEIVEFLGAGSFGTAVSCIDHKTKQTVAVKIVKNKKKYYYQASVELKILQYLRQHDVDDIMNVIHIHDYVIFRKHLCMSFELLSMNLFEFLKINDFNGFDHNLVRRFAIQLLYALKYLKQLEIIHCDLKPENILLKEENKSGIKIIDFGSSTFIDEKVYTYIQSRFYRAPEIMLGITYTPAIDMWSLGCIMAELYIGYPIFPGESENDQMSRIMEMRDMPPPEVLAMSERKQKFFTQNQVSNKLEPIMMKNSRGKLRKANGKPLAYVIGDEDLDFTDFVIKCLDWNPETRMTPDQALKHIWVLKGLPPQVLIHHQKMHNIKTPELPETVKVARDKFIEVQKRDQLIQQIKQAQRPSRKGGENQQREISKDPNQQRPSMTLKTPKASQMQIQLFKSNTKTSSDAKGKVNQIYCPGVAAPTINKPEGLENDTKKNDQLALQLPISINKINFKQ